MSRDDTTSPGEMKRGAWHWSPRPTATFTERCRRICSLWMPPHTCPTTTHEQRSRRAHCVAEGAEQHQAQVKSTVSHVLRAGFACLMLLIIPMPAYCSPIPRTYLAAPGSVNVGATRLA